MDCFIKMESGGSFIDSTSFLEFYSSTILMLGYGENGTNVSKTKERHLNYFFCPAVGLKTQGTGSDQFVGLI